MVSETTADRIQLAVLVVLSVPTLLAFTWVLFDVLRIWWSQRRYERFREVPARAAAAGATSYPGVEAPWRAALSTRQTGGRTMARGTIKRLVAGKGFGFIKDDVNGQELFFHLSACRDFTALREGQAVTFERADSLKGPRAENVVAAD